MYISTTCMHKFNSVTLQLCDEDQFCNYFLINALKKELRLCYDKKFIIKRPVINES